MKIAALGILALTLGLTSAHALQISEILSNPTGDDGGREWLEVYNNTSDAVDISTLTISVKGGTPDPVTPVTGGTSVPANGYAIIGAIVGGQTKFTQDYPAYSGPLFKSSITLVNTGTASIEISLNGAVADTLGSYAPAKDGKTLSRIDGSFQVGNPTPGEANQKAQVEVAQPSHSSSQLISQSVSQSSSQPSAQVSDKQSASLSLPSVNDIVIYLPTERIVIAGAETEFSVKSSTHTGKSIPSMTYTWSFGDGGQGTGSTTKYSYAYTGRYITEVEAANDGISATGRMLVKVVSPDIVITDVGKDSHGIYVDITNPSQYEVNLSQWKITFDGAAFPFPKNTLLLASSTTRFSGAAMGFSSLSLASTTVIKILFPHLEEVTRYTKKSFGVVSTPVLLASLVVVQPIVPKSNKIQLIKKQKNVATTITIGTSSAPKSTTTRSTLQPRQARDTRVISWVKGLLGAR